MLAIIPNIKAHGVMVRPAVWSDTDKILWGYDIKGNEAKLGCGKLELPEDTQFEIAAGSKPDCLQYWMSAGSEIPGKLTLSAEHMQPDVDCAAEHTEKDFHRFPWSAPGTASVFSPCGAMGGYPKGCSGILMDELVTAEKFGDLCPCDGIGRGTEYFGCGGFAYGGLAHQYDWPNAPITEWKAGSVEEVAWWTPSAVHGGGYAYRLCKIPLEGISGLTEECFQNGQLDFFGDKHWIYYGTDHIESGSKTEANATRINEGTFPPGSMWTAVPFPYMSNDKDHGHVIDKVQIPSSLEPGEYVLSFRWDCKCTSQVFSSCANIQITK